MGQRSAALDRQAVWSSFLRAHAAVTDVLEAELQEQRGLSLGWYDVLYTLSQARGGELRMQDLARQVLLSKSGMTRLFDRMEEAGLVERRFCEDDGRGTLAAMTPAGRRALRGAMPVHRRGIERHFVAHLTPDEASAMHSAFEKILRALGAEAAPAVAMGDAASAMR